MYELKKWKGIYDFQGESSSLCWLTIGKQLCKGIAVLTQLYCLIHINP